jgi:hypothetical protein
MPVDRRVDRAALAVGHAPDEGHVAALHRPGAAVVGELRGQRLMRVVVLGDHHQPGRVLVEPVHDARPADAADAGRLAPQWAISALTSVPLSVPRGRVHDQALRLVDDDDVVVLMTISSAISSPFGSARPLRARRL